MRLVHSVTDQFCYSRIQKDLKTLCLSVGMNDMWVIRLVKEMYLKLASIL